MRDFKPGDLWIYSLDDVTNDVWERHTIPPVWMRKVHVIGESSQVSDKLVDNLLTAYKGRAMGGVWIRAGMVMEG